MTTTWPSTIPQTPDVNQWTGGPQRNKVSFQPQLGASIDRRQGSAAGYVYAAVFSNFTNAERAAFEQWFSSTLYDGTLPFLWDDPVTGTEYSWKFMDEDPPYQFTSHGGEGLHSLSMKLLRLP